MFSKIVAVGAISVGLTIGLGGIAAADGPVPGPNSVGPFTQGSNEPTGKAACMAASTKTGSYQQCYEYPSGSLKYYYDKPAG
ncbi:hypothetical protein ABIA39_001836 [Nocardia sp. GAS34]